jgi:hypothetical protein
MDNTDQLKTFLSLFAVNLPTLLVCCIAVIVIFTKWRQASSAAIWALVGFGLILILCVVMPLGQTVLQHWVYQSGDRLSRMWAFSALGVASSLLHAVIYTFLLVAIFAGRPKAAG